MQLTIFYAIIALVPSLALANPVAMPEAEVDSTHLLTKRGIDFCPPTYRQVGKPCPFQSGGDGTPHACGKVNPAAILHCVNGKWAVERLCTGSKRCKCSNGSVDRGDIVCRA